MASALSYGFAYWPVTSSVVARTFRRSGVTTALVGVLALVAVLTAQFLRAQSFLGLLPGPGSSYEVQRLLAEAEETVVSQVAPVLPGAGIMLIICAALGLIAIIVDLFATSMRMPAASGLGLVAVLVAPAIVKPDGVGMFAFVVTALTYLLVLALAQWRENRLASGGARASSGFAGRSAIIGAAALAVTLILPLFVPGFTSGAFPQGSRLNVWGSATGLNPAVTLGNDLRNPTGFGRITYSTNADSPLYLRAVTLEDFSGRRWEPNQRLGERESDIAQIGTEQGVPEPAPGTDVFTRVSTQSYASPWLLSPYAPEGITDLDGSWAWDPTNLSVLATDGGSTASQDYLVQSREATLTREGLRSIGPADPDAVPDVFLQLPNDAPEIVRTTTEEVTGQYANPYDKALAIQNFLRGPDFVYSVEAPVDGGYDGNSMDVMARFLEVRSGYCVHYAGTMAVMARAAGIPSRVAVGYTPGSPTGNTKEGPDGLELPEFVVDSRNAHAWPELYFEGVGWVQFEPTPSRGVVPDYAQQTFSPAGPQSDDFDSLEPGSVLPGTPGLPGAEDEQPSTGDEPGSAAPQNEASPGAELLALIGVALVALLPFLFRTSRTRSRRREVSATDGGSAATGTATTAWAETTEIAGDYGYPLEPTDTPRTYAGRLALQAGLAEAPAASMARLRSAYEHEEYAASADQGDGRGTGSTATLTRPAVRAQWDDVDAVTRALRSTSSWSVRFRACFFPQSLLNRFRHTPRR
jgi:transglutaminase-like putative cysteine protease